ncbi:putative ribonuclease H-like domain-containing protein [Tanacetum coccineum]
MSRMGERIRFLEGSNTRLKGSLPKERERDDSVWRRMRYIQDELRQIRLSRYFDRMNFKRLETFVMRRLGYHSKTGSEVDAENTGSVVDGKVNVDTDGDGIGEPIRRNVIVETTESKALVAQDGFSSSSSSSSDSKVSTCSKACAYKAGLESVEARLDVYKKNEVVFEEDIKILKLDIKLRDNALTELRKKFEKAKKERDDLKLTLEKFGNSSKNLSKLLEIQVSDKFKASVGLDSQVVDSQVFDSQENDRYKTSKGYHAVPPPYTGNFMPPKSDMVLADEDEYVFSESITSEVNTRDPKGGRITGKGKISTCKLDFEDVNFVKELKFNLFSVSQMCDKKYSVLFNDTECVVLSPDFKLLDEIMSKLEEDKPESRVYTTTIISEHQEKEDSEVPNTQEPRVNQEQDANINSTNNINTVNPTVSAINIENNVVDENIVYGCIDDPNIPNLEEIIYSDDDEEVGAEAEMNNLATNVLVSPIPTIRVHKDHSLEQIIGDIHLAPQTRRMTKNVSEHEAMQDELLQFKLQKVWTLVDLPYGKRAIGTKWVYKNKKDDRGIVVRNKVRLVAQGYTQEEGINYDKVFSPIARIEAIRNSTTRRLSNSCAKGFDFMAIVKANNYANSTMKQNNVAAMQNDVDSVIDETVINEWEDRMERAATTASRLEVEQDNGNINRTQSMATLNESFPQGTNSGSSPKCQHTILGGVEAQIRFEAASKQSNDPPLSRVNTLGSGEDSMKLMELMEFYTKLSVRDFDL